MQSDVPASRAETLVPLDDPWTARPSLSGSLAPLGFLIIVFLAVIAVLLAYAAHRQNELALKASEHLAQSVLSVEMLAIAGYVRDYAVWDDAVENLVLNVNETWATENIGRWAYENLAMDATFVVDGRDRAIYQMIEGERFPGELTDRVTAGLRPLIQAARESQGAPPERVRSGFVLLDGAAAMAAAAPVQNQDGRDDGSGESRPTVLIYVRALDAAKLDSIAENYLLTRLRLSSDARSAHASLPLSTTTGEVLAHLHWQPERPGGDLLAQLIGPGLAVLAVIGPLIFLVIARAYGTIKCLRDRHHQLQALALSLASARDESDAHASAELELRRQAESAYQAKSDFLALISHELRTPLNAIIGFSEILRATGRSPSRHSEENIKYLDYIHQNGEHLLSLINDMIDLTRIESGRYQPRDKCAPLQGVLERCVMLLRQEALDSGIDVSCAATTVIVRADQQAMKQMIVSLLSNAIKFTGRGGNVRIMVDLNDAWLEIRVCDTGIGMTEADLQRAQAPFGQASRTMIRSTGGTGLGLNIARALAKAHGGDLELQSEHGVGTVAFLRLPRIRVSPTLDDPTPLQSTPI